MKRTTNLLAAATRPAVPALDLTKHGKCPFTVDAVQQTAAAADALPTPRYTGAQLDGHECARCGVDLAYVQGERPYFAPGGERLNVCYPRCEDVPLVNVLNADFNHEAPAALRDSRNEIRLGLDFAWPAEQLTQAITNILQEAFDSGRWVRHDTRATPADLATKYARRAVDAELNGLDTHPRTTADQLHRAIDDESARHLAKVGGHSIRNARAVEAFSTANRAMEDALAFSEDRAATVRALQAALDMLAAEAAR